MARFKPPSIFESDLTPYPISKLFLYVSFIVRYFFSFILLNKTFVENLFICMKIRTLLQIRFYHIVGFMKKRKRKSQQMSEKFRQIELKSSLRPVQCSW